MRTQTEENGKFDDKAGTYIRLHIWCYVCVRGRPVPNF